MKRLRVKLLSILLVFAVLMVNAEIPVGYYTGLNGKTTSELKTALCNIIYDHTPVSSYQALPNYFQKTDVRPNGTEWWEMYSNETFSYPSFSGMNREHSVPKSWWGGTTSIPAYTDLNHLYPSEMSANTAKSNYPLGEVSGTPTFDNGVSKVGYAVTGQGGGASRVFEPADEYKGDFARTYFYHCLLLRILQRDALFIGGFEHGYHLLSALELYFHLSSHCFLILFQYLERLVKAC